MRAFTISESIQIDTGTLIVNEGVITPVSTNAVHEDHDVVAVVALSGPYARNNRVYERHMSDGLLSLNNHIIYIVNNILMGQESKFVTRLNGRIVDKSCFK